MQTINGIYTKRDSTKRKDAVRQTVTPVLRVGIIKAGNDRSSASVRVIGETIERNGKAISTRKLLKELF